MMSFLRAPLGLGAAFAALMTLMPLQARGHTMHTRPISRQYSRSRDFLQTGDPNLEVKPFHWNANGPTNVVKRAIRETDPAVLAQYPGEGENFPLFYIPLAENGNYVEPNEIAVRHGVCGDPRKNPVGMENEDIVYSTEASNWPVIDSYTSGQVIELDIQVEYYHAGHIEMRICDTKDLADPEGLADQECFNVHQLDRASDDGGASPIDPSHRGRYIIDPPCRKGELDPIPQKQMAHTDESYQFTARYVLPDIECEHCILQMHHLTGSRCRHVGYDEFNPPSWPSECAPNKEDWIDMKPPTVCGERPAYPEEFWQCSDIRISRDSSQPAPTPTPTTPDEPVTSAPVTPEATPAPVTTPEATATPATAQEPAPTPVTLATVAPTTPEATAAPSGDGVGAGYVHLGCFKDSKADRVLSGVLDSDGMTTQACFEYCSGSIFMATQYGRECWCWDTEELDHERHGEADCDYECAGDENESCGGFDAFDLYYLEDALDECQGQEEVLPYEQCGGNDGYDGPTCCTEGYECVELAGCYSQCREM